MKVGQVAQVIVGVVLVALGGFWALMCLDLLAYNRGDSTEVTYAYYLGLSALGVAVAFVGGVVCYRAVRRPVV